MTDQSGAFPETLREAPNFAQMCDDFLAQETAVTTEHKNGWGYLDVSDGSPARHYLNAFVGFLSRRFHEYAALERPRPAPPEPQALAALLCETSPSEEGHSWYLTGRPLGPCTAHRSQAARLTGRVFVGSAGTGAAPPDVPKMGALEASLRGLACRCHGDTEGHEASDHLTPSEREVFDQVRRAERPVTTGAAPPKSTLCFHSFPCPSCGEELGQVLAGNYTFTKPHPLRLTDAEFARRRDDMLAGRAPGAEKVGGGAAQPPPSAPSPEAPSGPWRTEPSTQFVDYWTVTYNAPVDAAPRNLPPAVGPICTEAEAIAVRDALNRVSPPQPEIPR